MTLQQIIDRLEILHGQIRPPNATPAKKYVKQFIAELREAQAAAS